ncbi:hypothetical protein L596_013797 [Steinernema carpocapsae]|uniref:Uncharacterized protein n=1 Tax=Steinernema carpocapsae TaxID=34508 RepID=A0A4U5P1S3_STECR|nr:hypothetical protein L596_013797 [Steinernema carpocapsae]
MLFRTFLQFLNNVSILEFCNRHSNFVCPAKIDIHHHVNRITKNTLFSCLRGSKLGRTRTASVDVLVGVVDE